MDSSVDSTTKSKTSTSIASDPSSTLTSPSITSTTSSSANPQHQPPNQHQVPSVQLDPDAWVRAARPGDENHHLWVERFGSIHSAHPRRAKSSLSGSGNSSSIRPTASSIFPVNDTPSHPSSRARSESVGAGAISRNSQSLSKGPDQREVRRTASALDSSRSINSQSTIATKSKGRDGTSRSVGPSLPTSPIPKDGSVQQESEDEDYGLVGNHPGEATIDNPPRNRDQHQEPSEDLLSPEELKKKKQRKAARREKRKLKGKGRELPMPILPPRNSSTIISSTPISISNHPSANQAIPAFPVNPTHHQQLGEAGPASPSSSNPTPLIGGATSSDFPPTPTFSNFSHSHSNSLSASTSGHGGLNVGGAGSSSYASAHSSTSHVRASSNGSIPASKSQQNNTAFPSSSQASSNSPQVPASTRASPSSTSPANQNQNQGLAAPSTPARKSMTVNRQAASSSTPSTIATRTSSILAESAPTAESLLPKANGGERNDPSPPSEDPQTSPSGSSVKRSLDLVLSKARFGSRSGKDKAKERSLDARNLENEPIQDSTKTEIKLEQNQTPGEAPPRPSRPVPATPPTDFSPPAVEPSASPAPAATPSIVYPTSSVASRAPTVLGGRPLSRVWDASEVEETSPLLKANAGSGWAPNGRHSIVGLAGEETEDGDEFYDAKSDEGDEGEWSEDDKNGLTRTRRESSHRSGAASKRRSRRRNQDRERSNLMADETVGGPPSHSDLTSPQPRLKESVSNLSKTNAATEAPGSPNEDQPAWDQREKSDPLRAERELIAKARAMRRAQRESLAEEKAMAAAAEVASQGSEKQLQAAEQAYIEFMIGEAEAEKMAMDGIDFSQLTEKEREEARIAEEEALRLFGGINEGEEVDLKTAEERQLASPLAKEVIDSQGSAIGSQNPLTSSQNSASLSPVIQNGTPSSSNPNTQPSSPLSTSTDQDRRRNLMEQNTYFIPSVKNKGSVRSLASLSVQSHSTLGGGRPGSRGHEDNKSISQINSRTNSMNRVLPETPRSKTKMAGLLKKMRTSPVIVKLTKNLEASPSAGRTHDFKDLPQSNSVKEESEQEAPPRKSSSFGNSFSRRAFQNQNKSSEQGLRGLGLGQGGTDGDGHNHAEAGVAEEPQPRSSMSGGWRARVQSLSSTKSGKSEGSRRGISSSTPPPPTPPLPAGKYLQSPQLSRPSTSGNDSSEIPNASEDSWRWNLLNEAVGLSLGAGGRKVSATSAKTSQSERNLSPSFSPSASEATGKVKGKRIDRRHGELEVPPSIAATPSVSETQNVTIRKTLSPRLLTDENHEADTLVEEVGSGSEEELKDPRDPENESILLRQHGAPIEAIDEAEELFSDDASSLAVSRRGTESAASRRGSESGHDSIQGTSNQVTSTWSTSRSPALMVSRPSMDRAPKSSLSPRNSSSFSDYQHRDRRAPPPAALDLSPSSQTSRGRFEDDSGTSPFLGGSVDERETSSDAGKRSTPNSNPASTPNHRTNIVPAFFLKSPASEFRANFASDRNVDRSPVSSKPISPSTQSPGLMNPSPKVSTGLFGALKSGMGISSGKSSPYGLSSGVSSSATFSSQNINQQSGTGGLAAVEEATRLLQNHTDAMTPSPMPSPMPTKTSFSENQSRSNGEASIGLGLGPAWEAQNSPGLPTSSTSASSISGRAKQFSPSNNSNSSLSAPPNKTPQTPDLRAFDDMLRGFGKAEKALLKDIAEKVSKDSPLQAQSPVMRSEKEPRE